MPMVKCECGWRGNARFLPIHQKTCKRRLRILKGQFNQRITQTLDYRLQTLSVFSSVNVDEYDLSKMPDLLFNDLVFRLDVLQKDKLKKENELELQKQLDKEKEEQSKIKKEELTQKEIVRLEKEELDRIEQGKRVSENTKKIIHKKETLEKSFEEKRNGELAKVKTKEQLIKEEINTIDSLLDKTIDSIPEKTEVNPKEKVEKVKAKKGRPKKNKA